MFPNQPLYVDKLLQTRQDEIVRGLPDPATYEFEVTEKLPIRLRTDVKILMPVGVLLALAWWLHVIV